MLTLGNNILECNRQIYTGPVNQVFDEDLVGGTIKAIKNLGH